MLTSGYVQTRLTIDRSNWMTFHTYLGYLFAVLLLSHFLLSVLFLRFPWRKNLHNLLQRKTSPWIRLRMIQRASAWFVLASSLLMVISGLNWYSSNLWNRALFHPHVSYDLLTSIGIIIHSITGVIIALKRNKVSISLGNNFFVILAIFAIFSVFYIDRNLGVKGEKQDGIRESWNTG